jgi:ribonuclease HII
MNNLLEFDRNYLNSNIRICGVDEVGRGPLAGPVVVAAVILIDKPKFQFLNDSKKLNEKQRNIAFQEIVDQSIAYSIVEKTPEEIDSINILRATLLAMKEAVETLNKNIDLVLVDGNQMIDIIIEQKTIIKGDSKSAHIAAASILAKVHRDRLMQDLDQKYPVYNFASNKGYGTLEHRTAILEHGPCEIHRKTFIKNIINQKQMSIFK